MGSLHGLASVWLLEENFLGRQRAEVVLGVGPESRFEVAGSLYSFGDSVDV